MYFDVAGRRIGPFAIALLGLVTLFGVIAAVAIRVQLKSEVESFLATFQRQNYAEFASGDAQGIAVRLNASSSLINWNCIVATRQGVEFFRIERGPCSGSYFVYSAATDPSLKGGIHLAIASSVRSDGVRNAALISTTLALLLAALFSLWSRLQQQRQAHELDIVRLQKHSEMEDQRRELATAKAIAATTQMLAHDVRKPFSILRAGLRVLESAESRSAIDVAIRDISEQVELALRRVNGMIQDVMEVGSGGSLAVEPIAPESLIEMSVTDSLRARPDSDVLLEYQLRHRHMVAVDGIKVLRVFSNILDNAIQAMNGAGTIWIGTADVRVDNTEFVEFSIGNSGPTIAPADLGSLFDAFFTRGKRGGTGLGLAIAKKIVVAHGGTIGCASSHGEGTRFSFSLPADVGLVGSVSRNLPKHTKDAITEVSKSARDSDVNGDKVSRDELALESSIASRCRRQGRRVRLLMVDDEPLYMRAVASHVGRNSSLSEWVTLKMVEEVEAALLEGKSGEYDVVICDVDLASPKMNGFQLTRSLRQGGFSGGICIHSNRALSCDYREAIDSGADSFIPKPMPYLYFLRLIDSAIKDVPDDVDSSITSTTRPVVAIIEDDVFLRESWEAVLSGACEVLLYDGPRRFMLDIESDVELAGRITAVVTDYFFDGEELNGAGLARSIRNRVRCPIVLCSNGELDDSEIASFTARIEKEPVPWEVLSGRLK